MIANENIGEAVASASGDVTFEHSLLWDNESFGAARWAWTSARPSGSPPALHGPADGGFALKTAPRIDAGVANQADLDDTPLTSASTAASPPLADKDGDGFVYGRDCNDDDAIFPGADDRWYDGIDTNDLFDDYDQDGDGRGCVFGGADCDDTNARIFPGARRPRATSSTPTATASPSPTRTATAGAATWTATTPTPT